MTVAELIERLRALPQDAKVITAAGDPISVVEFDKDSKDVWVMQGC